MDANFTKFKFRNIIKRVLPAEGKEPSPRFETASAHGIQSRLADGFSWVSILIPALLLFFVFAVSEPIGDDILNHFDNGISLYLDNEPHVIGERVTSLTQVFRAVAHTYLTWSGRVTGYLFMDSIALIPPLLRAAIMVFVFVCIILLALRLVYGNVKQVLYHPAAMVTLFLALYWYKPGGEYTRMWTMCSVYSIPLLLCLLYYNLSRDWGQGPTNRRQKICLTLLGIAAGLSNEIFGAVLIVMLGVDWLKGLLSKTSKWTALFRHTGLGIAYLFCFFAPGNFNRMQQSHDQTIYTISLFDRLQSSLSQHKTALHPTWDILFWVFLSLCFLAALSFLSDCFSLGLPASLKKFLSKNLSFLIGGLISILAWGFVSYVPSYGVDQWICLVYITLLQTIHTGTLSSYLRTRGYRRQMRIASTVAALGLCFLFLRGGHAWLKSYTTVAMERQELIETALEQHQSEVIVPRYPKSASHPLIYLGYINEQQLYDRDFVIEYWGTHIIISDQEGDS